MTEDAAAAKSLQSCLTLCNPIDSSPSGSPIPGILQARVLEWGAIAFSTLAMLEAHKTDPKIQIPRELLKDTQFLGPLGLTKLFRGPCIYLGRSCSPRMRSHLGNICSGILSRKEGVRRAH